MEKRFKKLLEKLEPEIGKFKSIEAEQEEVYPRHADNATYIESKILVELEDKWLILYNGPDKYGEYLTKIGTTENKSDSIWDLNELDFKLEEELSERDISIEMLCEEIYMETHMVINRTIDKNNITLDDVLYLMNISNEVMSLRIIQKTLEK